MATRTRKLDIEIGSEAKNVGKGFDKAAKEGDALADKLGKSGKQGGDKLSDGVDKGTDQLVDKLRIKGKQGGEKFSDGVEQGTDGLGEKLKSVGGTVGDDLGSGVGDAVSGGFDIGSVADSLSGLLGGLGGQLGPVAGVVGTAVGGALAFGVMTGMENEVSSDRLAAQLALDPAQQERLGEIAGELYADAYGESLDEVNVTLGALISSVEGFGLATDEQLSKAGAMALDFASIWGVDVTEAIGDVGILVNTGLAGDVEEAFDLMTVAMRKMPASFREELIPAVEEYSGFLSGLGFTGEEMFGLMTQAAQDFGTFGIDKSMDAIKEFQIRATDMSTASVEAFDTIGLDAQTMANRILAGGDTARGAFDEIVEGLLDIEDPSERANTAIALFGTPIEDLSVQQIPTFLENLANMEGGMGDVAGAAVDAGDTLNDNAATRFEEFKRRMQASIVDFVDTQAVPALGRLGAGFDTHVRPALERIAPAFEKITGFFREHPAVTSFALSVLSVAASMVVLFNPLSVGILVIGGLIAAFQFLWDKIQSGWRWIQEHWPGLATFLKNPIAAAASFIAGAFTKIRAFATTAKNWIVGRMNDVLGFFRGMPGKITGFFSGLGDGIVGAIKSIWNSTIGGFGFTFGGWDPPGPGSIPGFDFRIPSMHEGGEFRAPRPGGEGLAMLLDGEVVSQPGEGGGDTIVFDFSGATILDPTGRELEDVVVKALSRAGAKGVPVTFAGRRLIGKA